MKIRTIQIAKRTLCNGHRKDWTTLGGSGTETPQSELISSDSSSTLLALANTADSGIAKGVPGSAHNGSCFRHQPFSGLPVDLRRERYEVRLSAAAAHKRGMAAMPRGVSRGLLGEFPAGVAGVFVGV